MRCPFCENHDTRVIDSRPTEEDMPSDADVNATAAERGLRHMKRWKV